MGHQTCAAMLALLGCSWSIAASSADPGAGAAHAPPLRRGLHVRQPQAVRGLRLHRARLGRRGRRQAHRARPTPRACGCSATSVGFLTESAASIDFSPDFLDAACRNFEGKPFVVPWLWDHKHKGQSAWWWCTNSPLYRKYLEQRLAEVMKAQPDGLHIDDYRGTSGRGHLALGLLLPPLHGRLPRVPGQDRAQGEAGRAGHHGPRRVRLPAVPARPGREARGVPEAARRACRWPPSSSTSRSRRTRRSWPSIAAGPKSCAASR